MTNPGDESQDANRTRGANAAQAGVVCECPPDTWCMAVCDRLTSEAERDIFRAANA